MSASFLPCHSVEVLLNDITLSRRPPVLKHADPRVVFKSVDVLGDLRDLVTALQDTGAGEETHIFINVLPELLQTGAEVIESGLATASLDEAVLGAFAVAAEQKPAVATLPR